MSEPQRCQLCRRITKLGTTRHHLIPRTCHSKKWFRKTFTREELSTTVDVCRDCHRAVHTLEPDEKELGRNYNTVELLTANPMISRYLTWIRKQK